ncbi:MAG: hypothetical protein B7Z75_12865 [Acidocella sp. 20-57-95]|nr:MAG: hypothetical protein B7Z75_12865 [Acidocella sp. 20-57-95]
MAHVLFRLAKRLANQRGSVALIVALSAPILIGATGLAVDIGYWYEEQEVIQSAADAAALAAATASIKYGITTSSAGTTFASGTGETFAVAAANNATNGAFTFSSSGSYKITLSANITSTTATWTATATIPRRLFFSGASGITAGTQSASGVAETAAVSSCPSGDGDGIMTGTLNTGSAANIYDTNGCISVSSNAAGALTSTNSGYVLAANVAVAGGSASVVSTNQAYIGSATTSGTPVGPVPGTSTVSLNTPAPSDPLSGIAAPPTWPTMPSISSSLTFVTPLSGYTNKTSNGSSCLNYSGNCTYVPGNYNMGSMSGGNLYTFNYGSTSGTTYIEGGIRGSINTETLLNGNYYYIAGPGVSSSSNTATGVAWTVNSPIVSDATVGTTTYVNGGFLANGANSTITFGPGYYYFQGYNSSTAGFNDTTGGTVTFNNATGTGGIIGSGGGSTFFFKGGLHIQGSSSVVFGPGIYYVDGGNLTVDAGGSATGTGVTFVLENGAGYSIAGSSSFNVSAPEPDSSTSPTNCVTPANYASSNATTYPYDGTDGKGICDVLIYQPSSNSSADSITEGGSMNVHGAIYTPSAALTISGAGTLTITTGIAGSSTATAEPGIEATSITTSGSAGITVTQDGVPATGSQSSSGGSSSTVLLVQ